MRPRLPSGPSRALAALTLLVLAACGREAGPRLPGPPGMVWVAGGTFTRGTDDPRSFAAERPAHRVRVDGLWMDAHEVTNRQFAAFVEATGHVTTAERPLDWEALAARLPPGTPRPPDERLRPGAAVFTPPRQAVPLDAPSAWWTYVPGACWKHPEGPGSDLRGRQDHPVVQVSWSDATAYAAWAGKRLPTEAEWEHALRGGREGARYPWGDQPPTDEAPRCNIWQGEFPWRNTAQDGHERTAPVGSFPPDARGLFDLAGNVWEWCADLYRADAFVEDAALACHTPLANPRGPARAWDPDDPHGESRVIRGGSFLCHRSYCEAYRTSARRGLDPDTGMSHVGFRCVVGEHERHGPTAAGP